MRQNRIKYAMIAYNEGKAKEDHITTKSIARALDVAENTVYRWMMSTSEPSVNDLQKIAEMLGIKARDLIANNPISKDEYWEMRKICKDWNPCEMTKKEFKEWLHTDEYGMLKKDIQYVSDELLALLISHEEYEKAAIVRDAMNSCLYRKRMKKQSAKNA